MNSQMQQSKTYQEPPSYLGLGECSLGCTKEERLWKSSSGGDIQGDQVRTCIAGSAPTLPKQHMMFKKVNYQWRNSAIPEEDEESINEKNDISSHSFQYSNLLGSCKKIKGANFLLEKSKIEQNQGDRSLDLEDSQLSESEVYQKESSGRIPLADQTNSKTNNSYLANVFLKKAQDDELLLKQLRAANGKTDKYSSLMSSISLQKTLNPQETAQQLMNSKTVSERQSVGTASSSPHFLNKQFAFDQHSGHNNSLQSPKYQYLSPQRDFITFGKQDQQDINIPQRHNRSQANLTTKQLVSQGNSTEGSLLKKDPISCFQGKQSFQKKDNEAFLPDQTLTNIINHGYQLRLDCPKKQQLNECEGDNTFTLISDSAQSSSNPQINSRTAIYQFSISHPKNQQQQPKISNPQQQRSIASDKNNRSGSASEHMSELDEKIQYYFNNSKNNKPTKKRDLASDSQDNNSQNQTNFFNTINQNPISSSVSNAHRFVNLSNDSEVHEYSKSPKLRALSPTQNPASPHQRMSNVSDKVLLLDGQKQVSTLKSTNQTQTTPVIMPENANSSSNIDISANNPQFDSKTISNIDQKSSSSTLKSPSMDDLSGIIRRTNLSSAQDQKPFQRPHSLSAFHKNSNEGYHIPLHIIPSHVSQPYLSSQQLSQYGTLNTGNDTSRVMQVYLSTNNFNEVPQVNLNTISSQSNLNILSVQEGQQTQRFSKPFSSRSEHTQQQQQKGLQIQRKIQGIDQCIIREEDPSIEKQFSPLSNQKPILVWENNDGIKTLDGLKKQEELSSYASEALRIQQECIIEKQASHLDINLSDLELKQQDEQGFKEENSEKEQVQEEVEHPKDEHKEQDEQCSESQRQSSEELQNDQGQLDSFKQRIQETKQNNSQGEFYQNFHSFQPTNQVEFENTHSSQDKMGIVDSNSQSINYVSQHAFCFQETPQKLIKIEENTPYHNTPQNAQESQQSSQIQQIQHSALTSQSKKYNFNRSADSYTSSMPSEYKDIQYTPCDESDNQRNSTHQGSNSKNHSISRDQFLIHGSNLKKSSSDTNVFQMACPSRLEVNRQKNLVIIPKFKNNNLFNQTVFSQIHQMSSRNQEDISGDSSSYPSSGYSKEQQKLNEQQQQESKSLLRVFSPSNIYRLPMEQETKHYQAVKEDQNDYLQGCQTNTPEQAFLDSHQFNNAEYHQEEEQEYKQGNQYYGQEQQGILSSPQQSYQQEIFYQQQQPVQLPMKSSAARKSISPAGNNIYPIIKPTKSSELKQRVAQEKLRGQYEEEQRKREKIELRLEEERKRQENHENQIKEQNRILRMQNQKLKEQNNLLLNQFEGKCHASEDTSAATASKIIKESSPQGKYQADVSSVMNSQSSNQSKSLSNQTSPKVKPRSYSNQQHQTSQSNEIQRNYYGQMPQTMWLAQDQSTATTGQPQTRLNDAVSNQLFQKGIIISLDQQVDSSIQAKPPSQLFRNSSMNTISSLLSSTSQEKPSSSLQNSISNNQLFMQNPADSRQKQNSQHQFSRSSSQKQGAYSPLMHPQSYQQPFQEMQQKVAAAHHGGRGNSQANSSASKTQSKLNSQSLGSELVLNKYLLANAALSKTPNKKLNEGEQVMLEGMQSIPANASPAQNENLSFQSSKGSQHGSSHQGMVTSSHRQQALLARFKKPNVNEAHGIVPQVQDIKSNISSMNSDASKNHFVSSTNAKVPIKAILMQNPIRSSKSVHNGDTLCKQVEEEQHQINSVGDSCQVTKPGLESCQSSNQVVNSSDQSVQGSKNSIPGIGGTTAAIQIDLKSNSNNQGQRIRSSSHNQQAHTNKGNKQKKSNSNSNGTDAIILNNAMTSIFQKIENCYNDLDTDQNHNN